MREDVNLGQEMVGTCAEYRHWIHRQRNTRSGTARQDENEMQRVGLCMASVKKKKLMLVVGKRDASCWSWS